MACTLAPVLTRLIHGRVTTGVEVQRSSMTASRAVIRTGKAASAGVS